MQLLYFRGKVVEADKIAPILRRFTKFVLFYAKNKELFVAEMAKENEVFPKYDEVKSVGIKHN